MCCLGAGLIALTQSADSYPKSIIAAQSRYSQNTKLPAQTIYTVITTSTATCMQTHCSVCNSAVIREKRVETNKKQMPWK